MAIHNLEYYRKLWNKYEEFKSNNQQRKQTAAYLYSPDYLIIDPISKMVSRTTVESGKWAYPLVSESLCSFTNAYCPQWLAKRLETTLTDPISIGTLYRICTWVNRKSLLIATRKPLSIPLISDLDRALIATGQHAHIVSKDFKALLEIPKGLRSYLFKEAFSDKEKPITLAGKAWAVIKNAFYISGTYLLQLIVKILKMIWVPFSHIPHMQEFKDVAENFVKDWSGYLYGRFVHHAERAIESGEKKLRKKIAAKAAEVFCREMITFTVGSTLRLAFGAVTLFAAEKVFSQVTGLKGFPEDWVKISKLGINVIAFALWVKAVTPTIQGLHSDYQEKFDPGSSTLVEIQSLFDHKNFIPLFELAKKKLI